MANSRNPMRMMLLGATALAGGLCLALATPAAAQEKSYHLNLPAQPLSDSLMAFGSTTDQQIVFTEALVAGRTAPTMQGDYTPTQALAMLLDGTGLVARRTSDGIVMVQPEGANGPQSAGAGRSGGGDVEALIVTAQKREEAIQDVPIAISAFSQKALEEQKIEGGFDLLKAIPNVSFSKNNFTSYNFSIRGVGTKAISATTDPGVSVSFNNTGLINNRLFEQEYFDVERVEVLRGPQGTLYGRNATSGVVNVISAKPRLNDYEGSLKAEIGNYDSRRLVGMLNVPIIDDILAVRLAGSWTQRTGYDYNETTLNNINGRDLWSGRMTVGFEPTPRLRGNLIWEHFSEDDNRSRTGKQLCRTDPGRQTVGSATTVGFPGNAFLELLGPAVFSQGCLPVNLYSDEAFGTPNGLALPFVYAPLNLQGDCGVGCSALFNIGSINGVAQSIIQLGDPYRGLKQSRDLRTVASVRDPVYRAKADIYELNVDFDITDALTLSSSTAYNQDEVYSFQDYNRFNSFPVFTNTSLLTPSLISNHANLAPGGIFCDPQIGCTDKIAGFDISMSDSTQFSQELRLQSDFDGPVNFSFGANYTEFDTLVDYYVMYNLITAIALSPPINRPANDGYDLTICPNSQFFTLGGTQNPVPAGDPSATCPYIDPNPVESINGEGHNYFRSKNPYKLKSWAGFGEVYWNLTEDIKITAGLRYTKDRKTFIPVPSQILLAPGFIAGGTVSRGYPEKPPIIQEWGEWTGRLGIDWKPVLPFTDQTMLYAFYSHGYKGGGANPPTPGFATEAESLALAQLYGDPFLYSLFADDLPVLQLTAVNYGPTFDPEFVDAFELGAKNTLLGGALVFNATAFYYDYQSYQVSQIRDRTAVNENFDAEVWGLEFESTFAPSRNLKFIANLGYLDTQIADGESSIDIMNRTQDDPDYVVVKGWMQLPSNCVVPTAVAENYFDGNAYAATNWYVLCGGLDGFFDSTPPIDPATGLRYDFNNYPLNGGAGISQQLGGNELPNAPHFTTNIGAEYSREVLDGSWRVTLRGDAYWQSQSWARVYNANPYDKLHGWYNMNMSVRLASEDLGLEAEFYVKNLLDKSPITDSFLNSDDSGLTTNVFVLDPRLVGFNVRKTF